MEVVLDSIALSGRRKEIKELLVFVDCDFEVVLGALLRR